jgi:hypothetical protein
MAGSAVSMAASYIADKMGEGIDNFLSGDKNKEKSESSSPSQSAPSASKYGDPNAGLNSATTAPLQQLAAGKLDRLFYGHYLPEHFKKTSIIKTTGRVR